MAALLSLAMPLATMGLARLIDGEDPLHRQVCLFAYMAVSAATLLTLLFVRYKIVQTADPHTVELIEKPGVFTPPPEPLKPGEKAEPPKKRKLTAMEYDLEKWSTHLSTKFLFPALFTLFLFTKWNYVVPLALQAVMGPPQHWNFELVQIYLRGKKAVGDLARPFAEPTPMEEMAKRFGLNAKPTGGGKKKH